jgi:hypothetical protein
VSFLSLIVFDPSPRSQKTKTITLKTKEHQTIMNPTNGNDKETNGGHSQNAPGNGNAEQVSRNPQQQPNLLNAAELNSLGGNNLSALLSQQQHGQNQNAAGLNILGNNILGLLPQQQQQQLAHNGNAFSFLQQQQQAQQLSQLQAIINSGSNYGSSNNLLPQQVPNQTMLMMLQLGFGQQPPAINANSQLASAATTSKWTRPVQHVTILGWRSQWHGDGSGSCSSSAAHESATGSRGSSAANESTTSWSRR